MNPSLHFAKWVLGLADAETQTTELERAALAECAEGKRTLVEIGVWHGVTTSRLRSVMAEDGKLYAVDPYSPGRLGINFQRLVARVEVRRVTRGSVVWIRSGGKHAVTLAQEKGMQSVDFIFIDGDHTYEGLRRDWESWSPLIQPKGIVALHDSRSASGRDLTDAGSARFTQETIVSDARFRVKMLIDSTTVLERV